MEIDDRKTNRYQSIKLVNWYRPIDDQSITTQKSFIDCYRLAQPPRTDVTHVRWKTDTSGRGDEEKEESIVLLLTFKALK